MTDTTHTAPDTTGEQLKIWGQIGLQSFGGPTAQIALMHRVLVEEKGWLTEQQFLSALSFCMLLPGPEAMQLATYAGWRRSGVMGGLIAGSLFVLPGAAVILLLATLYMSYGQISAVQFAFLGVKAAVLAIVVDALIKISKRALTGGFQYALAIGAFMALFAFQLPFPLVILIAAILGFLFQKADIESTPLTSAPSNKLAGLVKTVVIFGLLWGVPVAGLFLVLGPDHILTGIATFFSKLAVVTFGGAYAVLAYMVDDVVSNQGWLQTEQMIDGLGLAETTPGPLILVTEFVGFVAAYQADHAMSFAQGFAGAVVTLWVTFIPCFLWIFAGAPYIDWISSRPRLKSALSAITAAVVGVIANLSLWFSLHILFADLKPTSIGPATVITPDLASIDLFSVGLTLLSGYLLIIRKWNLFWLLGLAAGASLIFKSLV